MEQKTEASQAVGELSPTIVDEDGLPMAIAGVLRSKGDIVSLATLYMLIDAWGEKQRNHARAALKAQPAPTEAQDDGLSPVYAWLERSTRNSPAEVANAARTMMAFYQGAEFPEAEQGDPLDTKLPCDVVIGNMTIRKGVSLGVLVGKAQRDNTRLRELLPQPTPEQIAAFNAFLQNHITDAGEIVAAQGEDSARLDAVRIEVDAAAFEAEICDAPNRIITDKTPWGWRYRRVAMQDKFMEFRARASAETGGVKP